MRWLALFCLCACGRLGFDAQASGDGGSGTSDAAAFGLGYPGSVYGVVDATAFAIMPALTGSAPAGVTFSADAPLPPGVTLDATTGAITGTPTAAFTGATQITASAAGGSAKRTIFFRTLPGYEVKVTPDVPDDDGGTDTTCLAASAGGCTLRGALQTIIAHPSAGEQLILLSRGTYPIASALPALNGPMMIAGKDMPNTIIAAQNVHPGFGAFTLAAGGSLELQFLSVRDFGPSDGAVVNATTGEVLLDNVTCSNNTSNNSGGVLFVKGVNATIRRSMFLGNSALAGNGWGGVIDGEGANTAITVDTSFAAMNTAPWGSFSHITTGATLQIRNSTFTANTSTIAGTFATPGGTYTLINDTVAFNTNTNSTPDSAGIYLFMSPAHYTVENTIVAFNTDVNGQPSNCNRRDLTTSVTSNGGNIISDGAGNCGMYFTAMRDRLSTDPGLDPLGAQQNGDGLLSIALVPGSVAIDGGVSTDCPPGDERMMPRNQQACDVGAFEVQ